MLGRLTAGLFFILLIWGNLVFLVARQIGVGAATVKSGLSYPVTSLHLALTLGIIGFSLRLWPLQIAEPSEFEK